MLKLEILDATIWMYTIFDHFPKLIMDFQSEEVCKYI